MNILITGVTGSCGPYLIKHLQGVCPGAALHGFVRRPHHRLDIPKGLILWEGDLLDYPSIGACLWKVHPDVVVHMACSTEKGYTTPVTSIRTMQEGTVNLFESLLRIQSNSIILNISSAEIYGDVGAGKRPILEDDPKRPLSPYAVGKLAQDVLGYLYFKAYGLKVITLRCFSYINPHHRTLFSSMAARQIAEIEAGKRTELVCGPLQSLRCFMDVRDAVRAFWSAVERGDPGETYNVGGDDVLRIGQLLAQMVGMSRVPVRWREDVSLQRPVDIDYQVPDSTKFRNKTGWSPQVSLGESLQLLLDFYRTEVKSD